MDYSYITFNGWGIIGGRWVYIPIWDPLPSSALGQALLTIIDFNQHLRFIKNPIAIEVLKMVSTENAQKVALGFSAFDPEADNIGSQINWPPKKPVYPHWTDLLAFASTKLLPEYERVYAKANISQLGIQLNDESIQEAAA